MTFLVAALAVALTVKVGAVLAWALAHGHLRTSEQELYDWEFENIVHRETGQLPTRRHPSSG